MRHVIRILREQTDSEVCLAALFGACCGGPNGGHNGRGLCGRDDVAAADSPALYTTVHRNPLS